MKKRYFYMDVLNIIAIISVVALHCGGIGNTFSTERWWKTSLLIEIVCYFAVPIFVMLSGANLMNYRKKYDTKTFFKKRVSRVLIPTIAWFTIMSIWKICIVKTISVNSLIEFLNMLLNNKIEFTYYYLFVILGIYLTIPLLSQLTDKKYRKTLWYAVFVFFVFNSLIPHILLMLGITWNTDFQILIGGYIVYVILGYLLSTQEVPKKYRYTIYVLAILGMIYRYTVSFVFSYKTGSNVIDTWKGHMQFYAILQACAVFLFVKNIDFKKIEKDQRIVKIVAEISSCSFGVYLAHLIVKYYELEIFSINTHSWEWRIIGSFITYLMTLLIVYIIKKIPILKRIVG